MAALGLRKAVSKNKRRYRADGFDLDLSFITERIIAMGFPAENFEGIYRNPMDEVVRFLDSKYGDHYKVYNLCDNRSYDAEKFHGRVSIYPFTDHQPPTIDLLRPFCEDVAEWLAADPANVVAIHCKAGKGRTGVMICAYLLFSQTFTEPAKALEFYGGRRTLDMNGVTIPSQRRYVEYFSHILKTGATYHPVPMLLKSIHFECTPNLDNFVNHFPSFTVSCGGGKVYKAATAWEVGKGARLLSMQLPERLIVSEDVRIDVHNRPPFRKREKLFHFWFNTFFLCPPACAPPSPNGTGRSHHHHPSASSSHLNPFAQASSDASDASDSEGDGSVEGRGGGPRRRRPRPVLPPFSLGPPIHTLEIPKLGLDKANKDKLFPPEFKVHIFLECLGGASSPKGSPNGGLSSSPTLAAKGPPLPPTRQRQASGGSKMERVKSFSGDSVSSRTRHSGGGGSAKASTSSGALLDCRPEAGPRGGRKSVDFGLSSGSLIGGEPEGVESRAREGTGTSGSGGGSGGGRPWSETEDESEEEEDSDDETHLPVVRSNSKSEISPATPIGVDSLVPPFLSARFKRKPKSEKSSSPPKGESLPS